MGTKQNTSELHTVITGLMRQLESKDHMIEHLLEKVDSLEKTIKGQSRDIQKMAGIISTYERRLFGTSSEKTHKDQVEDLVEDDNSEEEDEEGNQEGSTKDTEGKSAAETTEEQLFNSPARKKKGYVHPRKRDYSDIDCDEVIELRPDAEEIKGARLVKVTSSFRFYYIPGKLCKVKLDRYIYSKNGHLITPKLPYVPETLEKRHASPNLIATLLVNKYLYHIPVERQLSMLNTGNIQIPKSTLHNWIAAGIDSLDGVFEGIREVVLSYDRMHIDETTMPVVDTDRHNSRKGYDWGFVSPTNRMMFFVRDNGSRGNKVLDNQMKDFTGTYIQTDGYVSYKRVGERVGKDIIQIPCLAHIKRKFHDSIKYNAKKAREALELINEIFANERQYHEENLKPNQIEARREIELRPLLKRFKTWLKDEINKESFFADSNIGKAIMYAWERIDKFIPVISNGLLEVSNNMAERAMRSHALGRKNFLFCQNEESANRTCKIYTIIESCKLCGVEPYKYLCEILSREPAIGESWSDMLPSNIKFA